MPKNPNFELPAIKEAYQEIRMGTTMGIIGFIGLILGAYQGISHLDQAERSFLSRYPHPITAQQNSVNERTLKSLDKTIISKALNGRPITQQEKENEINLNYLILEYSTEERYRNHLDDPLQEIFEIGLMIGGTSVSALGIAFRRKGLMTLYDYNQIR